MDEFRIYLENNYIVLWDEARNLHQGSPLIPHLNEHAIYIVPFFQLIVSRQGSHIDIINEIIPTGLDIERLKVLCQVVEWKQLNGSGHSIMNFEYDPVSNQGRIAYTP